MILPDKGCAYRPSSEAINWQTWVGAWAVAALLEGAHPAFQSPLFFVGSIAAAVVENPAVSGPPTAKREPANAALNFTDSAQLTRYIKTMRRKYAMQQSWSGLAYRIMVGRLGTRLRRGDTAVVSFDVMAGCEARNTTLFYGYRLRCNFTGCPSLDVTPRDGAYFCRAFAGVMAIL